MVPQPEWFPGATELKISGRFQGASKALPGRQSLSAGTAGTVVSLEISREILFALRQKYTWTSPSFFLDFPGLFPGFFWG